MESSSTYLGNSESTWKYQSASQYDKYYAGGDKSVYHHLYNNKISSHDKHVIQRAIYNLARSKDIIKVMDFGCGNGRHHQIYSEVAGNLAKDNKTLLLTAYEISRIALDYYISVLLNIGFAELEQDDDKLSNDKIIKILYKGNIIIRFLHINEEDSFNEVALLLGDIDLTICMFGVISHIQTRLARQLTLAFLGKVTKEQLILTLPGSRVLLKEQQAFKTLRESKLAIQINGKNLNFEPGDVLYSRDVNGIHIENFFHIYTTLKEIQADLKQANLEIKSIKIHKIFKEALLLKNPILSIIDEYLSTLLSYLLPKILMEKLVSYYVILAKTGS